MFVFLRFLACVRVGRRFVRVFRFQFFLLFLSLEMEMIDVLLNYVCTPGGNRDRKNKNVWT
jgi:hypothetical protein